MRQQTADRRRQSRGKSPLASAAVCRLKTAVLYCGDCFDILPKLDVVADAVISDPPFGITACDWDTP